MSNLDVKLSILLPFVLFFEDLIYPSNNGGRGDAGTHQVAQIWQFIALFSPHIQLVFFEDLLKRTKVSASVFL